MVSKPATEGKNWGMGNVSQLWFNGDWGASGSMPPPLPRFTKLWPACFAPLDASSIRSKSSRGTRSARQSNNRRTKAMAFAPVCFGSGFKQHRVLEHRETPFLVPWKRGCPRQNWGNRPLVRTPDETSLTLHEALSYWRCLLSKGRVSFDPALRRLVTSHSTRLLAPHACMVIVNFGL
jgi:hypothetical protein